MTYERLPLFVTSSGFLHHLTLFHKVVSIFYTIASIFVCMAIMVVCLNLNLAKYRTEFCYLTYAVCGVKRIAYFYSMKTYLVAGRPSSVGCASAWYADGRGFDHPHIRQHSFVEIGHEKKFIGHSLPSDDSRRAVVSCWLKNVHYVLVNCLGGLNCPGKVWIG